MDDTTLLTPAQAAARLPRRNGKKLHARTVKRWMIQGRLEGARKGGAWYTTIAAIRQFQAKNDCRDRASVRTNHPPLDQRRLHCEIINTIDWRDPHHGQTTSQTIPQDPTPLPR